MRKLVLLSLLACAACTTRAGSTPGVESGAAAQPAAATAPAAKSDTLGQIKTLIGKAACSSHAQCQVLPVGARPCGGPASYLAWSNADTSGNALQALADRYRGERQASNTRSGMVSDCRAIAPPAATCQAGVCQLTDALAPQ